MKTYKYLFLLLVSLSIVGCSDLEEEPIGLIAPESYFSVDQIENAVNGSLTHAINEKYWGRKLSIALMLRSDMVDLASDEARRVENNELTTTTTNGMISEFWPKSYQGISAANDAIFGASTVVATDEEKNPVVAKAYFSRAFYYFHLVRLFGGVPYITTPITTDNVGAISSMGRTPASEVYAGIISDLEFAKEWLPDTQVSRAIPTKAAASSYLALVYLTMAGTNDTALFQKAFDEAEEVIGKKGDYNLDLDPDFQNLFNAEVIDGSLEPIFALDYNNFEAPNNAYDQIAPMVGIRGNILNGGGWSVAVPSFAVYDTWNELDYRRAVSMEDKAVFNGDHNGDGTKTNMEYDYTQFGIAPGSLHKFAKQRPYIAKYGRFPGAFDRGNGRATSHNYSMMRYAEILLIAAEAGIEVGEDIKALGYINQVRARAEAGGSIGAYGGIAAVDIAASGIPAPLTAVTVADVLEERKLEFAFECIRWYDIVRRELGVTVYSAAGLEGAKSGFTADDYLLPLPADEIGRNSNLTQNPGYN